MKILSNLSNCDTSMKFGRYVAQTVENTNHLFRHLKIFNMAAKIQDGGHKSIKTSQEHIFAYICLKFGKHVLSDIE